MTTESILVEGSGISASNKYGTFGCEWRGNFRRHYKWNRENQDVEMIPRTERWMGSMGLYNPASTMTLIGGKRVVCEEGQLHFSSVKEAVDWLSLQQPFDWVYTNDGLTGGFFASPERDQVNIEFWQIYINGQKPKNLPNADNSKIRWIKY